MTRDELDRLLDVMENPAGDTGGKPGLITVESGLWVSGLAHAIRPTCDSLTDGLRYRNVKVQVSSTLINAVLTRADAGDAGEPYRDLSPLTP